jgi:hypothetical protein
MERSYGESLDLLADGIIAKMGEDGTGIATIAQLPVN